MKMNTLFRSKATAADILAILRDQHRHQCECDPEADPDFDLSFDSSVQDWRSACDLVKWKPLALALNDQWGIDVPLSTWERVLTPPKARRLKDVCVLIAEHVTIETVAAPTVFGRVCAPAGIFFAIRELLERDGADVRQLRPSSALSDFASEHFRTIAGPVSQLAPGLLPANKIDHPEYDRASWALVICLVGLFASFAVVSWIPLLWIFFLLGSGACWLGMWHAARYTKPASVTFGELKTIRDVCMTLAPGIRA